MEKLILFLIVFGIGSLFEYLKQKREQRADSHADKIASPRAAAVKKPRRQPRADKPAQPGRIPPLPQPEAAQATQATQQLRTVAPKTPRQPAKEGGSIFDMPPGENLSEAAAFAPQEQDEQLQRHYERWRRAVIDSEILRRKF